ncbi:MAG: hypothetical protein ACR2N8_01800 [Parvibaculales bacterium]
MVIYDVSGVKGFNDFAFIIFPFVKKKKLIVDTAKRRRSAKFTIAFSSTFILALVCIEMCLPAVDLLEWFFQLNVLFFIGLLCVLQWRPEIIYFDSQPDPALAKFSWTYLFEFLSTASLATILYFLWLVSSGSVGSSSPLAIMQQLFFLGLIVLIFIPLIDIAWVKRIQSARKG